ncbi:GNAT family N-acetyltransferase [Candidatus Woesearchaeota archaeon]|nr:GNAT family N-acetyltransferase [Candidatus Woesearchaeota archaeon]
MIIRKAKKQDFEQYFKLEEQYCVHNNNLAISDIDRYKLNKKGLYKKFLSRLKNKLLLFLVLESDSGLQGFFIGNIDKRISSGYEYKEKSIGYLNNVYISYEYRGKGYFSAFMNEFSKYLKKNNVKYLALHVDLKNKSAIKAYKKSRFNIIEYKMVGITNDYK